MSAAKEAVLGRIRAALREPSTLSPDAAWAALPRTYDRVARLSAPDRVVLLEDRLRDYDAEVTRVGEAGVAAALAAILDARGNPPMLLPPGFPAAWLPAGGNLTEDSGLTYRELDRFAGVLTTAVAAIADTGTLVLQNVPGQGRRAATLVPDFHLCVVREADVLENVPQAFALLAASSRLPTTFISGPSATADIEMTRIKGVHGPRFLHVLLAGSDAGAAGEVITLRQAQGGATPS